MRHLILLLLLAGSAAAQPTVVAAFTAGGSMLPDGTVLALGQPLAGRGTSGSVGVDTGILPIVAGTPPSTCPGCAADFNDDGGVDGGDVAAFFVAWEAGEGCGDVNEDGGVDGQDTFAFFTVWQNGGC